MTNLGNAKVWDGTQWVPAVSPLWVPSLVSARTSFVTVTANSSAHTKGAWTELIASTTAVSDVLDVMVLGVASNTVDTRTLLDIGVGAAGSETVIVPNVAVGGAQAFATNDNALCFRVPVRIPSGSRVAARIQSVVTGGKTASVAVRLNAGPNSSATSTTTTNIGSDPSTSGAVAITNALNSWTQLVASTAADYESITFVPSVSSTNIAAAMRSLAIATGAAGSEVTIATIDPTTTTIEGLGLSSGPAQTLTLLNVPQGTRLSVSFRENAVAGVHVCLIATAVVGR